MDKKEYIFRTLSRTKRKDYENFVINSIWNRVNNLELKPVTQQYVNCGDNWYLIDLFFPQINLAIEVDESHHLNQVEQDQLRSDQIVSALRYQNITDFQIERIDTHSNSFEFILKRIDDVVNKINKKISELSEPLKWMTHKETKNMLVNRGFISVYDNISFRTIREVVNSLFEYTWKESGGAVRSYFKYKHDKSYHFWFPKRKRVKSGIDIAPSGWFNGLSSDGKTILEVKDTEESRNSIYAIKHPESNENTDKRITFMKYMNNLGENGYKFVGIFHYAGNEVTVFNGKEVIGQKYILVSDSFNFPNLN
jgi:very-short-patch-repair endonuclease